MCHPCREFNINFLIRILKNFSFDKTVRIWSTASGELLHTLKGHTGEVVCVRFNPKGDILASGSMDSCAKLWDVQSGLEIASLNEHCGEVISLCFSYQVHNLFIKLVIQFLNRAIVY